jgi:hypothetical protein
MTDLRINQNRNDERLMRMLIRAADLTRGLCFETQLDSRMRPLDARRLCRNAMQKLTFAVRQELEPLRRSHGASSDPANEMIDPTKAEVFRLGRAFLAAVKTSVGGFETGSVELLAARSECTASGATA